MKTATVAKKNAEVNNAVETAKPALAVVNGNSDAVFQVRNDEDHIALVKAGFTPDFLERAGERMVTMNTRLGVLMADSGNDRDVKDVLVKGRILGATTLVAAEYNLKIIVIRCDVRSYWVMIQNGRPFTFFVPTKADSVQRAAIHLIENNLWRGQETFETNATRIPNFFFEMLRALYPKFEKIAMTVRHERIEAPGNLLFYPDNIKGCMLSVAGNCHDFNFVDFPTYLKDAINAAMMAQKKLKNKVASLPVGMHAQKPRQVKRADKTPRMAEEEVKALTTKLNDTLESVRERAHELNQPKKVRDMVVVRKQPKAKQDGGKKKNGKK